MARLLSFSHEYKSELQGVTGRKKADGAIVQQPCPLLMKRKMSHKQSVCLLMCHSTCHSQVKKLQRLSKHQLLLRRKGNAGALKKCKLEERPSLRDT